MKIVDLSLPIHTGMPVFPGDPEVSVSVIQTHEKEGWEMRRIEISGHDGTHVNAANHMVPGGKSLDQYPLESFCGPARVFKSGMRFSHDEGVIFRDQNIDAGLADTLIEAKPKFVGLSSRFEFDVEIERRLLSAGLILFERLHNLESLPDAFEFFGMPLKIEGGDGSPIRAIAVLP